MNNSKRQPGTISKIALTLMLLFFSNLQILSACDDTLVMLLTAQNPASEFSRTIRAFTNDLTILGTALKAGEKDPYDQELNKVMASWLEFSKRYMNNPPEEAVNDARWVEKTSRTAKSVGEIRKLISGKAYGEAHNQVLELSSGLGAFFEGFGISGEKQLFIKASAKLTLLEKNILTSGFENSRLLIAELNELLQEFEKIAPKAASASNQDAKKLLLRLENEIDRQIPPQELDKTCQLIKTAFEEQRSQILLQEWFPEIGKDTEK